MHRHHRLRAGDACRQRRRSARPCLGAVLLNAASTTVDSATRFRGWWILGFCTVAIGFTAPGQTIGVSAFTDHFVDDLGLSRTTVSTAYLVGTLAGATTLPWVGRFIDKNGVRNAMVAVSITFAIAIAATGAVQGVVTLALAYVGIRMLGQGALSLVSQTGIAVWFDRKRGLAIALSMTVSAGMMAAAPILLTQAIDAVGWRWAWVLAAVAVLSVVTPIALFGMVNRPADLGQYPDGIAPDDHGDGSERRPRSWEAKPAVRTAAFWAHISVMVNAALLITGFTFHHIDMLGRSGLSRVEATGTFVPQVVGTLAFGFLFGWLTDRWSPRLLQPLSAALLIVAMWSLGGVDDVTSASVYSGLIGVHMGSIRALGSALLPKWFGTDHIGEIRGISTSLGVGASALGPVVVAVAERLSGSYVQALRWLTVFPLLALLFTATVGDPAQPEDAER